MIRAGIRRAFHLALWRDPRRERDVDDEIALHLALRAEQLIAEGVPRDKAVEEAVRRFGRPDESRARLLDAARHREQRMQRAESFDNLRQDTSFALRSLRRQKGWTAITITTIALGVGATTAVFSVVSSLLLHPLPYPDAGHIVFVHQQPSEGNVTGIDVRIVPSASVVRTWKRDARHFEAIEGYGTSRVTMRTSGDPARLYAAAIEPTFPAFAGQRPLFGRMFTAQDIAASGPVALLGEQLWRTRFAGDSSVVGKTIWVNDSAYTVLGVLPASLQIPTVGAPPRDIWLPLDLRNDKLGADIVARLRPGSQAPDAARELDSLFARSQGFSGAKIPFKAVIVTPAQSVHFHDSLIMLIGAVALVLLVAFANVAHLVMARSTSRERELAIRAALGAGRLRLFWQLLTESLVLAIAGSVAGVLVGWVALRVLVGLRPQSLSALAIAHLDGTTLLVALAVALVGGLAFGVVGAMQSRRYSMSDALKSGTLSASPASGRAGARALLLVSEMALSTMLLVCAMMVIRSVINLQQADLGFAPANLYVVSVVAPKNHFAAPEARTQIVSEVIARLRRMPGVASAAVTATPPGSRSFNVGRLEIQGESAPATTSSSFIDVNQIETEYFRAMGIRMTAGTTFTDTSAASHQVVVNAGFARAHWGNTSAVGRQLRIATMGGRPGGADTVPWLTIVGVAADARTGGPSSETPTQPLLYRPLALDEYSALMLRSATAADPTSAVRAAVRSIDPRLGVDIVNVGQQLDKSLAAPRFMMLLLSIFTALALVLSAIGLYGVMAFAVMQRTKEIGIRIALGASMAQIGRAVVARALGLALVGAAVGVFMATWGTKLIEHELYGVARSDLSSFVVAVTVLLGAATVACIVPMRRAIGVDPIRAIRSE